MKKILIILVICFLMTGWILASTDENPERTKTIYRGSKYRPHISIIFFDKVQTPYGPITTGWIAKFAEYKILGRTRYVGGIEYLTKEQLRDENTSQIILAYLFFPKSQEKIIIATIDVRDEKEVLRVILYDEDLDGHPDGDVQYVWVPDFDAKTPDLLFGREIEKKHAKWFKKIKKQINFKKIEQEFQEWLKEE